MIPVTLITGFLGSGKTTLLNQLLRHPSMATTMVVVNEFGEIGIDQALIAAADDSVVLLTNGCLCCSVRSELLDTLRDLRLSGRSFARLAVETSGLADPSAIIHALLTEPSVASGYQLTSVVTTVDAVNGQATLADHRLALVQAGVADHLVVTKQDIGDAAPLIAELTALNPLASIHDSRRPLDPDPLFSAAHLPREAIAGQHAEVATACITRQRPFSLDELDLLRRALTDNLGPNLLRLKGLVNVAEQPDRPALLQGAQKLLHDVEWLDRWPDDDRRSRLVFITTAEARGLPAEVMDMVERMSARR